MQQNKFLKVFIEDCKYYDLENKELKAILRYVKAKNKTILDVGAGIGRLSFPLTKYAKEVVALEKDKRLASYFEKYKNKKVKFVNQSLESYTKKSKRRKFDIILLAWPTINFKFINLVKRLMYKNSKFILITCDNNSDFETIIDKLDAGKGFEKYIKNKQKFLKNLPKRFKLLFKKKIKTYYSFPNKKIAFRIIKNSMELWFRKRFNKKTNKKLGGIIKKHKKGEKVIFEEEIWFYLMGEE